MRAVQNPKKLMIDADAMRMGFLPILSARGPKMSVPTVAPAKRHDWIWLETASGNSHSF